ncbi:MAG: glutamate synthase subunit beta [Kiritimatiellia bacterium]|nr:glutamate synthase subunit beta [Kiritimatiellia bacterium]
MGKPTGFMEFARELPEERPVEERIGDYRELARPFPEEKVRRQAARCMNCGVPFCHSGCPLGNLIPDWNDLVYRNRWEAALHRLLATNNFPEFTGRVCPAPCEESCVLGIQDPPVAIELIEKSIVEMGFERGWIRPEPPAVRTGKRIAVIGSGPSGLAAAQQLNRAGHSVTVYERDEHAGGLLRYGIPDFKLQKDVVERRVELLRQEGIVFETGADAGTRPSVKDLLAFDAVMLCGGASRPRNLTVPGRELEGVVFAMHYLRGQNRALAGIPERNPIHAGGKHVLVIGGGDTGSDCVGTAIRQGAKSVTNFELLPMPQTDRPAHQPWPFWPMRLRTSSSHHEGGRRFWSLVTRELIGSQGRVRRLKTANVEFAPGTDGRMQMRELPQTEYEWRADLVILALGFLGPDPDGVVARLGVELDGRGNVKTDASYRTRTPRVYAAGDMRRGQSLVVWAISEGREAARFVDLDLMGRSLLPTKGGTDLPRI